MKTKLAIFSLALLGTVNTSATGEPGEKIPEVIDNPAPSFSKTNSTKIIPDSPHTREFGYVPKYVPFMSDGKFKIRPNPERKTVALALGGGGVRGAAHVGVISTLEKAGIPIDYVVGNSMGAIVGGLYAAGCDMDSFCTAKTFKYFRKAYVPSTVTSAIKLPLYAAFRPFVNRPAGIANGKKYQKFLEKQIPDRVENIESLKIPYSAVVTNLKDGQAYRISEGNLATVMRASSSITPILSPVKLGDKICMDGGVRANLPASAARDTGADIVIAVVVDDKLEPIEDKKLKHFRAVTERITDIVLAVTDENQMQFADVVISPDVNGISILSKKKKDVDVAMRAGELAAQKALPLIRKKLSITSAQLSETARSH